GTAQHWQEGDNIQEAKAKGFKERRCGRAGTEEQLAQALLSLYPSEGWLRVPDLLTVDSPHIHTSHTRHGVGPICESRPCPVPHLFSNPILNGPQEKLHKKNARTLTPGEALPTTFGDLPAPICCS